MIITMKMLNLLIFNTLGLEIIINHEVLMRNLSAIIVLFLIIIPHLLHSATYTVKSDGSMDYTTISAAVSAASNGDTLQIYGTITGDGSVNSGININKNLTIIGQGAGSTIVEAASTYNTADRSVFSINNSVTAVIQDMTIRHGKYGQGAGINNKGTLSLKKCIIEKNVASSSGGGINYWGSGLTITDCTIRNNVAGIYAAGILLSSTGAIITNSTINGNTTGGGIAFDNGGGTFSLSNCTISGNTMALGYLGAGINVVHGTMNVSNCTITNNVNTGGAGGGIGVNAGSTVNMKNSIVAGNTNTNYSDIFSGGTFTSQGYNIVGNVGNFNFQTPQVTSMAIRMQQLRQTPELPNRLLQLTLCSTRWVVTAARRRHILFRQAARLSLLFRRHITARL